MNPATLKLCRSLLFLPASNPRAIEKARRLAADMIVLDCEDAVRPEDKAAARVAAVRAAAEGFGDRLAAIRINAIGSPWYGEDIVAIRDCAFDLIIVPKVESHHQIHDVVSLIGRPVLAMIETARGVLAAQSIAPGTLGLIAGTNDLSANLGIPITAERSGLSTSLQAIVLAARAVGIAAFDGVYNGLDDEEGLARQCREGRAFGFDGKSLIHPSQIDTANRNLGPSDAEIDEARRLIAAATGGAERFEGRMVEAMHVSQAQAILAKARAQA